MKVSNTPTTPTTQLTPEQIAQQEELAKQTQGKPEGVQAKGAHKGHHARGGGEDTSTSSSSTPTLSSASNTLDGYPTNPFGE